MKVFIVQQGDYESSSILAVYGHRELAQKHVANWQGDPHMRDSEFYRDKPWERIRITECMVADNRGDWCSYTEHDIIGLRDFCNKCHKSFEVKDRRDLCNKCSQI